MFALWYPGMAVKSIAVYRMWRLGLVQRFPTVFIYIVVSVLRSVLLASIFGRATSELAYAYTTPLMLLLEGFAVVGVFWAVTEKYPSFRSFGTVLLLGSAAIGAVAAWSTRFLAVPAGWEGLWKAALLVQRYGTAVMAMVLASTRLLLPRVRNIPIRPSATRAADILTLDAILGLASAALVIADGGRMVPLKELAPVVKGMSIGSLWAFWLPLAADCRADSGNSDAIALQQIKTAPEWDKAV